jgi:cytochrome c-type biogenesis protein CcmH
MRIEDEGMKELRVLVVGLALVGASAALAVQPDEMLRDPSLEARARALSQELRCMVCQNQSIDDSDAPLARDLRILVRERLQAGDSDQQVIDYLTDRYGDFVLLRPRLSARTALLWSVPLLVLIGGAAGLIAVLRRQRQDRESPDSPPALTADEQKRLADLVERQQ